MTEYCALTDGESGVAPFPSRAASTSNASSCLSFRMRRRGESGRNGTMAIITKEKTGDVSVRLG